VNSQLQEHRGLLIEILDQLIPANPKKRIPAAGSFGVVDFIEARATDDEFITNALNQLLSKAAEMDATVNADMVAKLESTDAENFRVLLNLTYMGYYSRPEIRSLVGVASWPVHPKGYEVPLEPADMIEELTAPVRSRGPMYRDPSDGQQVSSK